MIPKGMFTKIKRYFILRGRLDSVAWINLNLYTVICIVG